ncbi:MAG TPA: 1-acyl-sn-glycerol-3-phosphate acyltransferase [Solirubrobacteraceae bacterium]|nr:1-acyl-sn-glycerol-3-phosphate acyltransferase [Solirubrobacteraceae bacterium]
MPPAPIRRPLTVTTWLVLSLICLILSPVLLALAAITALILRRPQPLMFIRFVIAYFTRELGGLVACGVLWVMSGFGLRIRSRRMKRLHYRLLNWYVHGLAARVLELLDIDIEAEISDEVAAALKRDRPLLFFSRHAGPGDTLLLIDLLQTGYGRLPSVVFKDALAIDPCVDIVGHRLPHAVLDTSDREKCEARIREVTTNLDPKGVLVLFPEGGNFTPERRRRAVRKLWEKGRRREARAAGSMEHVMPPHPTGALAALAGRGQADVIFAGHTGLGLAAFPRELWRHTPIGGTLTERMWLVPASEIPADPDEQVNWLYDWWKRIDDWVDDQGEEPPPSRETTAVGRGG